MGVGTYDYIDKLLVDKYANEVLICADQTTRVEDKNYLQDDYNRLEDIGKLSSKILNEYEELQQQLLKQKKSDIVQQKMKNFTNPNMQYERLGVDVLCIQVSTNLLSIADPDQGGSLLKQLAAFRYAMTDSLGYILPNVRVIDSTGLQDNTYCISIRNKVVFTDNLSNEDLENNNSDEIINNLYKMCMKYAHQLVTKTDVLKLMELVRSQDPTLVNDLVPTFLSPIDLKHIFANLYQLKIGVKDIILVFEILNDYARYTQDRNELTELLKKELLFN